EAAVKRLHAELSQRYPNDRAAIGAVERELRLVRDRAVRLGDIVAPTAHEATIKMVFALNRERLGDEVIGHSQVRAWPDVDEVLAEIELEQAKARSGRGSQTAKRRVGRPKKDEKDSAAVVIAALCRHHGYQEDGSVANYEPATNRGLAAEHNKG